MIAVAIIWVVVGLILWVSYKVTHGTATNDVHAPPQKTLNGAMMWPFYLGGWVLHKLGETFGMRSKNDDE